MVFYPLDVIHGTKLDDASRLFPNDLQMTDAVLLNQYQG